MTHYGLILCVCLYVLAAGIGTQAATLDRPACGKSSSAKYVQLLKPSKVPIDCIYSIKAYSSYVCQLRIDMTMILAPPTLKTNGSNGLVTAECSNDYFLANGIRFCGFESNQHIYVPFNRTNGLKELNLLISTKNRANTPGLPAPSWDLRVTQLECPSGASVRSAPYEYDVAGDEVAIQGRASINDGFYVAPPGCLQYFPHISGTVNSFNWQQGHGVLPSNLNYAICFRRQSYTTSLRLNVNRLQLGSVSGNAQVLQTDNACYNTTATSTIGNYLLVPQATLTTRNQRATYICGNVANDVPITSNNPGPLLVIFNSGSASRQFPAGFSFNYNLW